MQSFSNRLGAVLTAFLLLLAGCGQAEDDASSSGEAGKAESDLADTEESEGDNPIVTMEMEDGGVIEIELYPDIAPKTVENFVDLVDSGFYDGLTFHRVLPGFMIQGGDPDGNGTGGPGHAIEGEFASNGIENDLIHERGVVSMARTADYDSAGSQFFIVVADSNHLDGDYAAFGRVIEGMDVADEIVSVETDSAGFPVEGQEQVIGKMTVEQ